MDVTFVLERKYGHLLLCCHICPASREAQEEGKCSAVSRATARSSESKTENRQWGFSTRRSCQRRLCGVKGEEACGVFDLWEGGS